MSNAIAAVTVPDDRYSFSTGSKYRVLGTMAISASPAVYVTGGIVMSFFVPLIKASRTPIVVYVQGQSGYIYQYVPGADASLGLLKIFQQSAATSALTEIPASAIPAGVSGDTITFDALFFGME
jgi:hypothetical protein